MRFAGLAIGNCAVFPFCAQTASKTKRKSKLRSFLKSILNQLDMFVVRNSNMQIAHFCAITTVYREE